MRYFLVAVMAAFCLNAAAKPIDGPKFNTRDLSITWEALQNDSPKKGQALNAITVKNNGKATFPATGWKMYFNSARLITEQTVTGNATIKFVNGDLFSLTPTATFPDLKPGQSVRIEFIDEDPVITLTDGPEGFYVVWDTQPDKGYNTGAFTIKPFKPNYPGLITPAIVYDQNKIITDIPETQLTKVFPTPVSYKETGGTFKFDNATGIIGDKSFSGEIQELSSYLYALIGKKTENKLYPETQISIEKVYNIAAEGYELEIKGSAIHIKASSSIGAFHAIQSLKTLIPASAYAHPQKEIQIPCVEVKDEPRFAYRAFMLDVGRNFQPKKEIFRVLDVLALYKINVFHMHLTEDEGWRLEIPSLPELTEVGGRRGHTLDSKHFLPASHGSGGELDNKTGTGFYTRADFIQILKYADARHIMVMPEIEAPGHARAAIKSMNARYDRLIAEGKKAEAEKYLLYDVGDKSAYSTAQYWTDNVIDVSLPSTYNFVETVISDIVSMYKDAG
ncbi:MAG: family 20 glycosylhydrolase, partial [Mucilaginibacter sp.]